jgi:23S rRNA pseudouridine1911/1915/1917 synthase
MTPSTRSNKSPLINETILRELIIYEDEDIIVVNKPGWLVCHPSKNGPWSSLVGATRELRNLENIYLVGRLDRETSGVVLMAKNKTSGRMWQKALEEKKVRRSYLAILEGSLKKEVKVDGFIGNDPMSKVFVKQRVTKNSIKSKKAETQIFPLYSTSSYTFVSILTKTGRKHQIRLHAQSIGYPLVGEKLYGHDESYYLEFCESGWNESWLTKLGMDRQALHSRKFGFFGSDLSFEADLHGDFNAFLLDKMNIELSDLDNLRKKASLWEHEQMNLD